MHETAGKLHEIFLEIIIAPSFSEEALAILTSKKNIRLLTIPFEAAKKPEVKLTTIEGGLLVQEQDRCHIRRCYDYGSDKETADRGRMGST